MSPQQCTTLGKGTATMFLLVFLRLLLLPFSRSSDYVQA